MPGDEYELMPERKLSSMKKELDDFRKKAQNVDTNTGLPRETVSSLENLNKSIGSLLGLFQTATEELKLEERDQSLISKKLDPLMKKVDILLDQNEKIAKAIVAIADMVREKAESAEEKEETAENESGDESKAASPSVFSLTSAGVLNVQRLVDFLLDFLRGRPGQRRQVTPAAHLHLFSALLAATRESQFV